jgi:AcrR family transcriptional regulator
MEMDGMHNADRRTGTPGPEAAAQDARAESILAAACRVIVRRGFDATRIADIAREAGTSTGTVHYYFETKDDVLLAALKWANKQPYLHMDDALGREADELTRLAKLLEISVPYEGRPREEYLLLIELWGRILHRPELVPAGETFSARWRGYFFDIVRNGSASGAFRPVAGPDQVAERLVALVDGLGFKAVLGYRWMPPERMRELIFDFAAEQLGVSSVELDRRARHPDVSSDAGAG